MTYVAMYAIPTKCLELGRWLQLYIPLPICCCFLGEMNFSSKSFMLKVLMWWIFISSVVTSIVVFMLRCFTFLLYHTVI